MQERLQKIIATAGVTSRRKAEQMITQGLVSVNGQTVTELGSKADPDRDHIKVAGRPLRSRGAPVYLLLNKPVGYVSTVSDPEGRPTVISLLKGIKNRVYPVGRLDFNSSGIMLLTNDGELTNFLMSRDSAVPRTYQVKLDDVVVPSQLTKLEQGISLDGRKTAPTRVRRLAERDKPWYEITLVEGRYHQVRRMFERIGRRVVKLQRVRIAFLTDEHVAPGKFRALTPLEVAKLKSWRAAKKEGESGSRP